MSGKKVSYLDYYKKASRALKDTFVASESRTYVLFVAEDLPPDGGHYIRLQVPAGYDNNPYGIKKYFSNEINEDASIIAIIPAEMYDETYAYLHRNDHQEEREIGGNFVSPTRRYIITYKGMNLDERLYDLQNLPELYPNNVNGALSCFKNRMGISSDRIIWCDPYEIHLEHVRMEEKHSKHVLVSPSRSYVLYVENPDHPNTECLYLVVLPDNYSNDEIGAVSYLDEKILPGAELTNCLTYEMYLKQPDSRPISRYHAVSVSKHNEVDKIIDEIKRSLSKFYSVEIEDVDILAFLTRMEEENARYLAALTDSNHAIKEGLGWKVVKK